MTRPKGAMKVEEASSQQGLACLSLGWLGYLHHSMTIGSCLTSLGNNANIGLCEHAVKVNSVGSILIEDKLSLRMPCCKADIPDHF